jgi:hypothetical protein
MSTNGNGQPQAQAKSAIQVAREASAARIDAAMAANSDAIVKAFQDADTSADSAGFADTLASRSMLGLTFDDLAVWTPQKSDAKGVINDVERVIRDIHRQVAFEHSPAGQAALKRALFLAVHASSEDAYNAARFGGSFTDDNGNDFALDGERRHVGSRKHDLTNSGDESKGYQGGEAGALQDLQNWAGANDTDAHERECAQRGIAAVNNPVGLRALDARINRMQKRAERDRNTLYVGVIGDKLTEYASSGPATAIGKVWLEACAKAASTHRDFMDKFNAATPDVAGLQSAIETVVDNYLSEVGAWDNKSAPAKGADEKMVDCKKALWANARKYNKLAGIKDGVTIGNMVLAVASVIGPEPTKAKDAPTEDGDDDTTNNQVVVPQQPVAPAPAPAGRKASGAPAPKKVATSPSAADAIAELDQIAAPAPAAPAPTVNVPKKVTK